MAPLYTHPITFSPVRAPEVCVRVPATISKARALHDGDPINIGVALILLEKKQGAAATLPPATSAQP